MNLTSPFSLSTPTPTPLVQLIDDVTSSADVHLYIKRDDLIHPSISGNKWRKLYYNITIALQNQQTPLITFGGAYSNHIYATAAACKLSNIPCIGIIRGDELHPDASPTLQFCQQQGMQLLFVSRSDYRLKEASKPVQALLEKYPTAFIVPEGGANEWGVKGMEEVVSEINLQLESPPTCLAIAAGTGSSAAGLINTGIKTLVVATLKGGAFFQETIPAFTSLPKKDALRLLDLQTDYHFGGYGKYTDELLSFIRWFEATHQIPLEQVYTGKMAYAVYDLLKKKYFPKGSTLVLIHTGGLQGRLPILRYPQD